MITTGIIREINLSSSNYKFNKYKVELNIFQKPGDNDDENYTLEANCSVASGLYSCFKKGDKVYVGFINNNYSQPVILGKIYQGLTDEPRSYAYFNSIKINDSAEFPKNTKIGDISYEDLKYAITPTIYNVRSVDGQIGDVDTKAVKYIEQTLEDRQKQQAQNNIALSKYVTIPANTSGWRKVANIPSYTQARLCLVFMYNLKKPVIATFEISHSTNFSDGEAITFIGTGGESGSPYSISAIQILENGDINVNVTNQNATTYCKIFLEAYNKDGNFSTLYSFESANTSSTVLKSLDILNGINTTGNIYKDGNEVVDVSSSQTITGAKTFQGAKAIPRFEGKGQGGSPSVNFFVAGSYPVGIGNSTKGSTLKIDTMDRSTGEWTGKGANLEVTGNIYQNGNSVANQNGTYSTLIAGGNTVVDTRAVNSPPSYYADKETCYEFKSRDTLGLKDYMPNSSYVLLTTKKGWVGSYIVYQEAVSAGNDQGSVSASVKCYRYGLDESWGEWQVVANQNGTYPNMTVGNSNQLGGIAAASYAQLSQVVPNNIYVMSTTAITVDWDNVNWSDFDSVFGSGWRNRIGTYLCRINTTGNISQFGFSASYYCQIQVWYAVGGSSYALIVISDEAGNKYNGAYLYANTSIADSNTQVNFYKNFAIDPTIDFTTYSASGIEGWIQLTFASDLSTLEKGVYLVSIGDDMPNPAIVFWDPAHIANYYRNWFTVITVSYSSRIGFQLINISWDWSSKQIDSWILYFNGENWVPGSSLPSSTSLSLYKIL